MAELDKKTEQKVQSGISQDDINLEVITETPKRSKTHHKLKSKHKKNPAKVDGNRLRSSR